MNKITKHTINTFSASLGFWALIILGRLIIWFAQRNIEVMTVENIIYNQATFFDLLAITFIIITIIRIAYGVSTDRS